MKTILTLAAAVALVSAGAVAAGPSTYDAAGRMTHAQAEPSAQGNVKAPQSKPQGLLLPAIQKVRAADLEERRKLAKPKPSTSRTSTQGPYKAPSATGQR